MRNDLIEIFEKIFGTEGEYRAYFAPGRVNLIGEHIDYNGGHVFPCALTIGTYGVARKRKDKILRFYSMNFKEKGIIESSIDNLVYKKEDDWTNYPKGVIWALQKKGYKIDKGMDILIYGNIPNASGLSSSASLEVLTGFILMKLFNLDISFTDLALYSQYAENKFVGVNCGIMDQFAIAMGKKDHGIFLNTSNLSYEYAPLILADAKIVIMNTNKRRGLGDSKYNQRRRECEQALSDLQKVVPVKELGDLTEEEFEDYKSAIKNPIHVKRAKHAVYENQRTIKAVKALKNKDIALFGQLMNDSHLSLQQNYEVTGIELDTIVEAALRQEGVIGARMTGAGFGGCGVSIVKEAAIENFIKNVGKEYKEKIGYDASFYVVETGNGPEVLVADMVIYG
ncbi:galactokinase [Herbinix luporum]|uniref:galactokinase n=1 Tax=Herbinix luporum TaxID=1679721 RepID=UPI00176E9922|nr:galactokinase [Herbinix luporum]MDI9489563.1 galactokinase [Bacillota bacterium]HHT56453.1 galactokinase [Herbinix luporum]